MQIILLELKREYKLIYHLTNVLRFSVIIEPLKNKDFI